MYVYVYVRAHVHNIIICYLSLYTQETDGGIITKPKTVASTSSNVTKSTSALPPATKNTSNKNEDIKIRDNKMKKTGSASTIIPDPKKRLMVDEAKGKVHIHVPNGKRKGGRRRERGRERVRERERETERKRKRKQLRI